MRAKFEEGDVSAKEAIGEIDASLNSVKKGEKLTVTEGMKSESAMRVSA